MKYFLINSLARHRIWRSLLTLAALGWLLLCTPSLKAESRQMGQVATGPAHLTELAGANLETATQSKLLAKNIPPLYYLYWVLLGLAFTIGCAYCLWIYKWGRPKQEGLALAKTLIGLAVILYLINQAPQLKNHFDPIKHQFVVGYQEPPRIGFIKFFYKIGLGILLIIYGLIDRKVP